MFQSAVSRIVIVSNRAVLSAVLAVLFIASSFSIAWAEAGPSTALPGFPPELSKPITGWHTLLERIDLSLNEDSVSDAAIASARERLDEMQDQINEFLNDLRPRIDGARAQVEKLGAPPAQGQPPEPDPLAQQRAELNKSYADLNAALRAAESALVRSKDLAKRARDLRRMLFERRILYRSESPFSPALWDDLAKNAPSGLQHLGISLADWWERITSKAQFFAILGAALALWTALAVGLSRAVRHLRTWEGSEPPTPWQRSSNAGWVILLRIVPAAAAGSFLYFSLSAPELMPPPAIKLAIAAVISFVVVACVRAVARTVLTIYRREWRLVNLSDDGAAKLYWRLLLIAFLYALDTFVTTLGDVANMPFSLSVAQSCVASVALAYLIISILRIRAQNGEDSPEPRRLGAGYIRIPLWLVAFAILGAVATGYIALARFIAAQLIVTGTILLVTYLFLLWASAFALSLADDTSLAGKRLSRHAGLSQRRREQLNLPTTLLLRAAILIVAIPLVLLQWGFDARDVAGWFEKALFGFEIGSMRISVTTVVIAILIFMAVFTVAKAFQSWLDGHVLGAAGVDESVRNSVRTGVGYLGVGVAVLLAVSYTGLDFSNLAILAGALSVGIGFGLQSIVNNFVSGLILLAERPIKVGDWIVVGTDEGIVRRISVRSTEIETFDRANVIIPNSQLISASVKNWTLHNNIGRFGIPVGVHYDTDPEVVCDLMLEVARLHPQVLSSPQPYVYFSDFSDSALNFVLYVYLSNVTQSLAVRTELRIAILKVFRARGIEIPYRQTDVNLRDLEWIKRAILERMTKPDAAKNGDANEPHDGRVQESATEIETRPTPKN